MKVLQYILFTVAVIGIMKVIEIFMPSHSVSEAAKEADILLGNSRIYAKEHAYNRSLLHLEMAIKTITDIEQNLDAGDQKTIDKAVADLQRVYREIQDNEVNDEDMNKAYTKAMNALTYAEIKVSEHFLESEEYHEAMVALKYGMVHIQNALRFVDTGHRDYELHIYAEIDSLLENTELSNEEIIAELEKMLEELSLLVEE